MTIMLAISEIFERHPIYHAFSSQKKSTSVFSNQEHEKKFLAIGAQDTFNAIDR